MKSLKTETEYAILELDRWLNKFRKPSTGSLCPGVLATGTWARFRISGFGFLSDFGLFAPLRRQRQNETTPNFLRALRP